MVATCKIWICISSCTIFLYIISYPTLKVGKEWKVSFKTHLPYRLGKGHIPFLTLISEFLNIWWHSILRLMSDDNPTSTSTQPQCWGELSIVAMTILQNISMHFLYHLGTCYYSRWGHFYQSKCSKAWWPLEITKGKHVLENRAHWLGRLSRLQEPDFGFANVYASNNIHEHMEFMTITCHTERTHYNIDKRIRVVDSVVREPCALLNQRICIYIPQILYIYIHI